MAAKKIAKARSVRRKLVIPKKKKVQTAKSVSLPPNSPLFIGLCVLLIAFICFGFSSMQSARYFTGAASFLMAAFWAAVLMGKIPQTWTGLSTLKTNLGPKLPKFLLWLGVVIGSLVLGSLGQMQILQNRVWPTWGTGLGFYLAGTLLFILAMWLTGRDQLKNTELPIQAEKILFGLILLTAAVLRLIRLDEIPAGVFIDRGFAGVGGLRILHEHYIPPLNIGAPLDAPTAILWVMAAWFSVFKNTQANLYLLIALVSLSSFPFIYWFYRQLVGSRVALLGFYLLAVMRWNILFSRNGFTCIEMMVFMFGTLALLLYGLRTNKLWIFIVAGFFCAGGIYTYQSYKAFPALVAVLGVYETIFNFKKVKENWLGLILFVLVFTGVSFPILHYWVENGSIGNRELELSIISEAQRQHSLKPIIDNWTDTALMFNWVGDQNPRHNLSAYRMLDDVSGVLFVFGVFYALSGFWRRKNYYMLAGLFIMSLPCLLSTDAAHACRMVGITPFVTLLIAVAIGAIWGRVRAIGEHFGEVVFISILIVPMAFVGAQNAYIYFVKEAGDNASWAEFSTPESEVGKTIAANGNAYEYYVAPVYYDHFSLDFFAYFYRQHVHEMVMPDTLWARSVPAGEGVMYILPREKTGLLQLLQSLYPKAKLTYLISPLDEKIVYYLTVSPEEVDSHRGLSGKVTGQKVEQNFPDFPKKLPSGVYHGSFHGSLLIDQTGNYQFSSIGKTGVTMKIGPHLITMGRVVKLIHGYYPVQVEVSNHGGNADVQLVIKNARGEVLPLDSSSFTSLNLNRGLLVSYYRAGDTKGTPVGIQWEPVINYPNGNDFALAGAPISVHWTGTLTAPTTGSYFFQALTRDKVIMAIDHHQISMPQNAYITVKLTAGVHAFDAYYLKPDGQFPAFSLFWVIPGEKTAVVVPNSAFGQVY